MDALPKKKYIYQWNLNGLQVRPSWAYSEEAVWRFAIDALRPSDMSNDAEAERYIRENGTVVEIAES